MGSKKFHFTESMLRSVWANSELTKFKLTTVDKKQIEILNRGTLNEDGGPDFKEAILRIGGKILKGDVELHRRNKEWYEHKHHQDVKYNSVILHVVFSDDLKNNFPVTESGRIIPVLVIDRFLEQNDTMIKHFKLDKSDKKSFDDILHCLKNTGAELTVIKEWITRLGMNRIELKVLRFHERLHELIEEDRRNMKEPRQRYGIIRFGINPEDLPVPVLNYSLKDARKIEHWQQLLYEGFMEALGYSKNQKPFLDLSRNLPLHLIIKKCAESNYSDRIDKLESLLFGSAQLLDSKTSGMDRESRKRIRYLRKKYKEIMGKNHRGIIHKSEWQFFRLRPENFPTIRLAGAVQICIKISQEAYFQKIIRYIKDQNQITRDKFFSLVSMFMVPAEGFWKNHYRFGECSRKNINNLIGKSRAIEIVINVVIPIALLYARIFKDRCVRENVLSLLQLGMKKSINPSFRNIEMILNAEGKEITYQAYQGILHLYKFFCLEGKCGQCEFFIKNSPFHI